MVLTGLRVLGSFMPAMEARKMRQGWAMQKMEGQSLLLEPCIDKRVVIAGSHKTYGQNECHQEGTVEAPMRFSVFRDFVRYWENGQYGDR